MSLDVDTRDTTGAMPQSELRLMRWRDTYRRELPHYQHDFLRNSDDKLVCAVVDIEPALRLPWRYTEEQERSHRTWECSEIWLHSAAQPNGAASSGYLPPLFAYLEEAINIIARDKSACQHTLLVAPAGMFYDEKRYGGDTLDHLDHQVKTANGHCSGTYHCYYNVGKMLRVLRI
jgi:hypothetical protein